MKYTRIIIDTETGGLNPDKHKLLTVGLLVLDEDDNIIFSGEFPIKDDNKFEVTKEALSVNKLDVDYINNVGLTKNEFIKILYYIKYITDADKFLIKGWNIIFDVSFLKRFLGEEFNKLFHYNYIDINTIYYAIFNQTTRLQYACEKLNVNYDKSKHHTALYDCYLTYQVYIKLKELINTVKK